MPLAIGAGLMNDGAEISLHAKVAPPTKEFGVKVAVPPEQMVRRVSVLVKVGLGLTVILTVSKAVQAKVSLTLKTILNAPGKLLLN